MAATRGKINVEALTRKIEEKLSGKNLSPQCSIFKIPAIVLWQNKNAYEPNAFSIGPFHHGKENLKATETIKAKYLHDLLSRLPSPNNNQNPAQSRTLWVKKFTEAISANWEEARQYYGGPIGMEEDQFVEVLVLDGCFIVELFRKEAYESLKAENDPVFSTSNLHQFLLHDLISLENQIPWMVLDTLFNLTFSTSIDKKCLVQLAIEFFGNIFSTKPPSKIDPLLSHPSKHILDLLRSSLVLNSSEVKKVLEYEPKPLPSAKSLQDSGIRFEMGFSESILDIRFHQKEGILEIPTLFIHETTETLFRNLISLEQCCPNYDPIITSYAVLFDNLIKSKDDMEILSNSGAIYNWLNIDDAMRLFSKFRIDTFGKETCYFKLTQEVNNYCGNRWQRYRRVIMRDYLHDPWTFTSVNVAIIALILTFVQTVFAIIKE